VEAMRKMASEVGEGLVSLAEIDEQRVRQYLQSEDLPDPDLLIRTSGEMRLSNFMLWQLAYSELVFSDVYWPEYTETHFRQAIAEYQQRARRFGGL
jgi:undecaprenyl diphosphate synthase